MFPVGLKKNRMLKDQMEWISDSPAMTLQLGRDFGKTLSSNTILCIYGDLGAGKTTFLKGMIHEMTGLLPDEITSPTFVYLNSYQAPKFKIFHFDLYRLRNSEEFLERGFDEYLINDGICCIEWSERIDSLLPKCCVRMYLSYINEYCRKINVIQSSVHSSRKS
jgi:tRNA threonylcarbamoyladenosine biosynthesis protein TsaE